MAVDTPAKIAIIGAGPIGLEAALYARYLGYEVEVLHWSSEAAFRIRALGDQKMLTPFGMNSSPLGLRALAAQDETYRAPRDDDFLTFREWYERYIMPLSKCDLLADHIFSSANVISIGKVELVKGDQGDDEYDRGAWDFRVFAYGWETSEKSQMQDKIASADIVFDCSGVHALPAGHGGIFAVGELSLNQCSPSHRSTEPRISKLRDVLGKSRSRFQGKAVLVVGEHLDAASAVVELNELARLDPQTQIIWITRHERERRPVGPLEIVADDPLSDRKALLVRANELATSGRVRWLPGMWLERMQVQENDRVLVQLSGKEDRQLEVDIIIATTGHRPLWNFTSELQLDICPITDAPRPFSEYLLKRPSPYSVEYPAPDPSALITSEPNYYVLGSKSFGRMPGFLFQHGLRQIRDVFTIIGDRADLDLYAQK